MSWRHTFIAVAPFAALSSHLFDIADWEAWAFLAALIWYGHWCRADGAGRLGQ